LSETEARAQGLNIRVATMPMTHVARAIEVGETRGFIKAVVDADTKRILGCAVLGIEGGELMSMLEIAMMGQLPYTALKDGIFAHPTLAESLNNLLEERATFAPIGILSGGQRQPHSHNVAGLIAGIDLSKTDKALDHQPGADQQNQRQSNLGNHQHAAHSIATREHMLARPLDPAVAARLERAAADSLAEQARIEAADTMPFEVYRQMYVSPDRLGMGRSAVAPALVAV